MTRHKLHPGRLQYFCVSCLQAADAGDPRTYACTVALGDGAYFVASKQFALTGWKYLPLSTVYVDGERTPGSPSVGRPPADGVESDPGVADYSFNNLSSQTAYAYPWQRLNRLGLPVEQCFRYRALRPARLAVLAEPGGGYLLRPPRSTAESEHTSLPLEWLTAGAGVTLRDEPEGVRVKAGAVTFPPLRVAEDGVYLFKLKYQPVAGGVTFSGLGAGGEEALPGGNWEAGPEDGDPVRMLALHVRAGEPFRLRVAGGEFVIEGVAAYRDPYGR
jgi:hypothetical protein